MPPFPAIASISHEHPHILSKCEGGGFPSLHTSGKHLCERHMSFSLTHRNQKSNHTPPNTQSQPGPQPSLQGVQSLSCPSLISSPQTFQSALLTSQDTARANPSSPNALLLTYPFENSHLSLSVKLPQISSHVSTLPLLLNAAPHAGQGQQAALESSEKSAVEGRLGKRAIQGSPIRQ